MLRRIHASRPAGPLFAIGVSLGGNALLKWLGVQGPSAQRLLASALTLSAPVDLHRAGDAIDHGWNRWLYASHFLRTMQRKAHRKWMQYPGLFDLKRVMSARTLRDFDDAFTAPLHGFQNVNTYWRLGSSRWELTQVSVPTLMVNAQNDPLVPVHSLPTREHMADAIEHWQPLAGGHVGFWGNRSRSAAGVSVLDQMLTWLSQAAGLEGENHG